MSAVPRSTCLTCGPLSLILSSVLIASALPADAQTLTAAQIQATLDRTVLDPGQPLAEARAYLAGLAESPAPLESFRAWQQQHERDATADPQQDWADFTVDVRQRFLDQVVFRGTPDSWRNAPGRVEWLNEIPGGDGYSIRKLRYEALPNLWIPALLYVPSNLTGRVPVVLNVNGHDPAGKAAPYKQIRCINQARRGMLALNVEWFGMGQLATTGFNHYRLNQLDLAGASGLAPFFLALSRALDLLLAHPHADPNRVAVTGLSGGGWQTILISALDPRVTLANPVAGYGDMRTNILHDDFGDSEQSPSDLATVADYQLLTTLRAPRPTLLTYNAADDCCFRADHSLAPLLAAAQPLYALLGAPGALSSHINTDPGTHNFERDNRQALYAFLNQHFFPGDASRTAEEIPCLEDLKTSAALEVPLPDENVDLHALAVAQLASLAHHHTPWQAGSIAQRRASLTSIPAKIADHLHWSRLSPLTPQAIQRPAHPGPAASYRLELSASSPSSASRVWTLPVSEFSPRPDSSNRVSLIISDEGRASLAGVIQGRLQSGDRVFTIDPFLWGQSKITGSDPDYLFPLMLASLGQRAVALQAQQILAAADWIAGSFSDASVTLVAHGPRASYAALIAASQTSDAINAVELYDSLASLGELIHADHTVEQFPELFAFGLLSACDVIDVAASIAPRPVTFHNLSDPQRQSLQPLAELYRALDLTHDPLP
jgi:dienelactone hydrolase